MLGGEKELTEAVRLPAWSWSQEPTRVGGSGQGPLPENLGPVKGVASAPCQVSMSLSTGEGRVIGLAGHLC